MSAYVVICQSVVGGPGSGYAVSYDSDLREFATREAAISHGFKVRDSDDFNIGIVEGGVLVAFQWMHSPVHGHDLRAISESIGLGT